MTRQPTTHHNGIVQTHRDGGPEPVKRKVAARPKAKRAVAAQPQTDSVPHIGTRRPQADAVLDTARFFATVGAFPTGVTIITTLDADGQPRGLTSNAVCSVSADPPLLLVCVDRRSRTLDALVERGQFVVNFLVAERGDLSNRFASKEPDKFAGVSWRPAANRLPWLHEDSLAHAECTIVQTIEAGDHVIIIGRVDDGQPPPPASAPLMYFRRGYGTWPA